MISLSMTRLAKEPGTFNHDPLHKDLQEIRLVRLLESEDEAIRCQIQHVGLNQAPHYTALSYMWGDPARTIPIVVNGKEFGITRSLEIFFREMVSRRRSADTITDWVCGWLWIDAVCINQQDLVERSEEVAQMKEIYESAHSMVIWLGEAQVGSDEAMHLLEQIAALESKESKLSDGSMPGISCRFGNQEVFIETLYATLFSLSDLLNLTYWDRAWIIQEASTPKGWISNTESDHVVWVCCGSMTITWKAYAEGNRRLIEAAWENPVRQYVDLHNVANTNIATVKYLEERRAAGNFRNPLYPMLVRSRTSVATDPRDKLYAFLGLVDEREDRGLQPDYMLSVEQVYTRFAKTIITRTQSLDSLGSAGLVRDHEVPSWVPDWTVQHDRTPQPFYMTDQLWDPDGIIGMQCKNFNADKDMTPEINFDKADKQLVARGICLDRIEQVSTSRPWPDDIPEERWDNWKSIADPDNSLYISGCTRLEAFEKVLRADYREVWGDWSAERGGSIESFSGLVVNVFELHDGIVDAMTWYRRLFITSKGYMGIAPATLELGDVVCILFGSQMPMILREADGNWLFVGQAYIHGVMDGEALEGSDARNESRLFQIM